MMIMRSTLYQTNTLSWIVQCQLTETSVLGQTCRSARTHYFDTEYNQSLFFLLNAAFIAEKQQIPVLQFFGLTRLGLKLTMKAQQCVLYVWSLEIHLSRWEGWDSINIFNPDEFKCLSLDLLRHISWSFCVRQVQLR